MNHPIAWFKISIGSFWGFCDRVWALAQLWSPPTKNLAIG
jgi:hypothetical protein